MKDYVDLWLPGSPLPESKPLPMKASAEGEHQKHSWNKHEFARVSLSIFPADKFEFVDNIACRHELESLRVGWPDCVVFGVLDALMLAEEGPYYKLRLVLEDAAYHEADSTANAFRHAGRIAAEKIIDMFSENNRRL
jgi:hypothetical protein